MTEANPKSKIPPTPSSGAASRNPKSGVVVPHTLNWQQRLGVFCMSVLIRALMSTVRCHLRDRPESFAPNAISPAIFCLWHNRLASCIKVLEQHRRPHNSGAGMAALVSASRDGAFLAGILEQFRIQPVRGSSSRRGAQALLELTTWAERGYDLTITPDGPRGPRYQIHDGVMSLAQVTGLPIVPVALNLNWKIQLKSWDRFQIPLPFARCEIVVGKIMRVPRDISDADREKLRQELEAEMRAISKD